MERDVGRGEGGGLRMMLRGGCGKGADQISVVRRPLAWFEPYHDRTHTQTPIITVLPFYIKKYMHMSKQGYFNLISRKPFLGMKPKVSQKFTR